MTIGSQLLLQLAQSFRYTLPNGEEVWAPYLRNDVRVQVGTAQVPRGLGKSSPSEIKEAVEYICSLYPDARPEEIRLQLVNGTLPDQRMNYRGIDCSGFVYYLLNDLCAHLQLGTVDTYIGVPKKDVLNGALNYDEWRSEYVLSEEEISTMADYVPLDWVAKTFKRKPAGLCGVAALTSPYTSDTVEPRAVQNGDLIKMAIDGDPISHIGIVIDTQDKTLLLAHSGRKNPEDIGGVALEQLPYDDSKVDTLLMEAPRSFIGVFRPNFLT